MQPINADPDHVGKYTKAALCLHNFLQTKESSSYCPPGFGDCEDSNGTIVPGDWRQIAGGKNLVPIGQQGEDRHNRNTTSIRDHFQSYFLTKEGEIDWQYDHVRSTGNDDA